MTSDSDRIELATARYNAALHAVQTGVAMEMEYSAAGTEPKHLRVGVNSSKVEAAALAQLLIDRGVFTLAEYVESIAEAMERERTAYEQRLSARLGRQVTLA